MSDQLSNSGARRAVHLERDYPTTPDDLWQTWTDPERLARWLGTPTGPLIGASQPVRISMGDNNNDWVDVKIVSADAPRTLVLSWEFFGEPAGTLRVEIVPLTAGSTRLILDHDGLDASATGYGAGWQAFLDGPLAYLIGAQDDTAVHIDNKNDTTWDDLFAQALPAWRQRAAALD